MKPQDFAAGIRTAVIQQNTAIYQDLFASTAIDDATDPYWRRALAFYAGLSTEERAVFFEIIRQMMVDTVSNVLAILDGVASFEKSKEEFVLVSSSDPQKINGALQDIFLEIEERERR